MTHEQIIAMPAGPELDALVAERILGWRGEDEEGFSPCESWVWRDAKGYKIRGPTQPSTDIAAAWLVFQAMHAKLFSVRRAFMGALQKVVSDGKVDGGSLIAWPDAFWFVTPEAICKAALLAELKGGS